MLELIIALEHVAIASGERVSYSYVLFNAAHVGIGEALLLQSCLAWACDIKLVACSWLTR